ncbi:MAG TPA: hypothetical protein VKU19_28675 [Bryobacteraceae bacterium]|nr:hypothetical protein [Bryobacteraceae bacterium]
MRKRRHHGEAGFAMLLVFLMAAIVAIMLYMEVPRLAFDAQRTREQMLITRGEEYKRAIYMFMKQNKRWPGKIEELESLNNQRFLRKRFADPMTGSKEWRIIHIQNGMLTDSVITKPPSNDPNNPNGNTSNNGGTSGTSGSTFQWGASTEGGDYNSGQNAGNAGTIGATLANRKRSSDNMPQMPPGGSDTQPPDPNNPSSATGQPSVPGVGIQQPGMVNGEPVAGVTLPPGVPGVPGLPGQVPPGVPGQVPTPNTPGQVPGQGQYPMPITPFPGGQTGGFPGQPVNSQTGGVSPYPITPGANGGAPGFQQPGSVINSQLQGANQAQQMIQQILTQPRPGGMPTAANGVTMGGGIAGFASNADAASIKIYNDRSNYKEWEFVFDPTKVKNVPNPLGGGSGGTPASAMGSMGGSQIGTPVTNMNGAPSGFGNSGNSGYITPVVNGSSPGSGTPGFVTDIGVVKRD